jgi:hypothetical protein
VLALTVQRVLTLKADLRPLLVLITALAVVEREVRRKQIPATAKMARAGEAAVSQAAPQVRRFLGLGLRVALVLLVVPVVAVEAAVQLGQ